MKAKLLLTLLAFFAQHALFAQTDSSDFGHNFELLFSKFDDSFRGPNKARVVFWNVENLFDTYDNPETNDDEFTPYGDKHWNEKKYQKKLQDLSKTLIAVGGWEPAEVICLAEVENLKVVEDLVNTTGLKENNYSIIHKDSPDKRGIDVAFLYRPEKFKVIKYHHIKVTFSEEGSRPTRDILYVRGMLNKEVEVHIFVNHWPSRFGGHMVTDPKRRRAADIVRSKVDSILRVDTKANIIITGDFNDEPEDGSITENLGAKLDTANLNWKDLYNAMGPLRHSAGTHKFAGQWGILDQFFVSKPIVKGEHRLQMMYKSAGIFSAPFLLENDATHLGHKLHRTYLGPKYVGGYSDHLPIYLDLQILNKTLLDF